MRLPYLKSIRKKESIIGVFYGLNQKLDAADGEYADMKNLSSRFFPVMASRPARGTQGTAVTTPNGMIYKNHLFYVDGTKCYYNGIEVGTVTNGKKQLVGMGAYIVIFPDKKIFNTADGTFKSLTARLSGVSVTVQPLTTGSTFAKITATGINTTFKINDAVAFTGFSGDLANLNGQTKVITDAGTNYIVVSYLVSGTKTQARGAVFERKIPDMDYVCELDNRLWGCSSANHEVYSSKLGDPENWYNFEGIASDAFAATVGSDGDFTGCISHMGYVLFFKENTIHIMYGTKPSSYQLNTKSLPGVMAGCEESLQVVNETLYYVGRNGVYAYDGAVPSLISDKIREPITEAKACQQDGKYYLSCKLGEVQSVLVYDPKNKVWHREDDDVFKTCAYGDGVLHYVDKGNKLTTISGSRTESIEWFAESGDLVENSLDNKYVSKLKFNFKLGKGAEARVLMKYDEEPLWKLESVIYSKEHKTYTVPIIPRRCNSYRYRIEGKGEFKLFGLSREVEGGTENGNSKHEHW